MKSFLFTTILILITFAQSFGQDLNCQTFRNGTFKIPKSATNKESILIRKDNLQTETVEGEEGALDFVVNWIDDCTYTLTPTKATMHFYGDLPANAMLTVKIIDTQDNSYTQESTPNFADFKYVGTVIKME